MPKPLTYSRHFSVRVNDDELRVLHARATAAGLSLSRYIVEASLAEGRVPSPEERRQQEAALFHLRKAGVNLNQIAHRLNSGRLAAPAQFADALDAVTTAARRLSDAREPVT